MLMGRMPSIGSGARYEIDGRPRLALEQLPAVAVAVETIVAADVGPASSSSIVEGAVLDHGDPAARTPTTPAPRPTACVPVNRVVSPTAERSRS
jgi:hypothetical protein